MGHVVKLLYQMDIVMCKKVHYCVIETAQKSLKKKFLINQNVLQQKMY